MTATPLTSSLSWLDFAEDDRRTMVQVVSLFKLRETRDELGVGSIRNAFSELLFPGTSTLQTRARYFLFVPWLFRYYEERRVPSKKIPDRLRTDEILIIRALREEAESDGAIGRISGASLNRFPSSIYWYGLISWGIFEREMTQGQYRRSLDRFYLLQRQNLTNDEDEPIQEDWSHNWDIHLPPRPDGFPREATLDLNPNEAEYLREKLRIHCADSLLPFMAEANIPYADDLEFAWSAPMPVPLPDDLAQSLHHAQNFSEAMLGAALLYNLMLSEIESMEQQIDRYRADIEAWRNMMLSRQEPFLTWDLTAFWRLLNRLDRLGRIPPRTRTFVDAWLGLILDTDNFARVEEDERARRLVRLREEFLKGGRSRFRSKRHRELWSGASGAFQLDYRWYVARRLVNDIIAGLGRS